MGDEQARQDDDRRAVEEYRAALALDRCNGYAWAALGTTAARAGQPDKAALALAQAVQLLPRHYNAWTDLGAAYEALGRVELARESYRAALQARPGHQPAEDALRRLDRTPVPRPLLR
jgi:Flp pilus assembly protein TadD